jgi:hypothetical protein
MQVFFILGVALWVGLFAYTARALATWPVSASIPNAGICLNHRFK